MGRGESFDLRRLATFREVARQRSFSAAADTLNFTQSAVSQQVAALERQVGAALLHRNPISLTQAGEILLARADAAIAEMGAAEIELERLRGLRRGRLSASSFASAGQALLAPAIRTFREAHPSVEVTLHQGEVLAAERLLVAGEIDLALTFEYSESPLPDDPLITRAPLMSEPVFLAAAKNHRIGRAGRTTLEEIASEPWIDSPNAGLPMSELAWYTGHEWTPPALSFGGEDLSTVITLVEMGIGVALLPALAFDERRPVTACRVADLALNRTVFVSTLRSAYPEPAVAALVGILERHARALEQRWNQER
jgi:DNA-binding transcriptional LysR family regulator